MTVCPIFPTPDHVELTGGERTLCNVERLYVAEPEAARVRAFMAAAGVDVACEVVEGGQPFVLASRPQPVLPDAPPPEVGYRLTIADDRCVLEAADTDGLYAGLQSLWQLLRIGSPVPCCLVTDRPVLQRRAFQIDLGRQPETITELKRLLRQQAAFHYNECQLYLENSVKLPAFGDAADPQGLTPDDYCELQDFGADLGIDVVPSLNLLGHMEKILRHPDFAHLSEMREGPRHPYQPYGGCICPSLPESREFIARVISDICEISRSDVLMVGLDECWTIGSDSVCRPRLDPRGGAGRLFGDWINFLYGEVSRRDKQMWMWEDMLFYHLGALDMIPSEIGMNIWHYQHIEEYPAYSFQDWRRIDSIKLLTDRGHPAMLCCGPAPDHLTSMLRFAEGCPLEGLLVVQWEGSHVVQELFHLDRAVAAGVLWGGTSPDMAAAARAATGCEVETDQRIGELMVWDMSSLPTKGGGSNRCPRFWSWPENARARTEQQALLSGWNHLHTLHEALSVRYAFMAKGAVQTSVDFARETAALAGRRMIQNGTRQSRALEEAIDALRDTLHLAESVAGQGEEFHRRYAADQPPRPMVESFRRLPEAPAELLRRLERFAENPSEETWPFALFSLHVDGLVVDPSAHHARISVSEDGDEYVEIYDGRARLQSMQGQWMLSIPLPAPPRRIRLEIGGFASLAVTRVRMESLEGTRLPLRVVESGGLVRDPQHILDFDAKIALFNEPDILKNWLSLEPLPASFVVLEF